MTRLRATLWAAAEWIAELDPWIFVVGYFLGMVIAFALAMPA